MISIVYLTNRIDPKFEWFVDSLFNQCGITNDIELIFVDYVLNMPFDINEISRKELLRIIIANRFSYKHIPPKDNFYQGPNRKTTGEYFSTSNARNTGAEAASGDYVVFIDDVSVLMPGWFDATKEGARNNMIVCGSYQKRYEVTVENGILISSKLNNGGKDSRWNSGNDFRPVKISGGALFGCSLGIPKNILNSVDGFDEICDSIGGEDYHLGIRLNNAGHQVFYDRRMFTIESEEHHVQPYLMKREDRILPPKKYLSRLVELDVKGRKTSGNWDSSHMILDILFSKKQIKAIGSGDGVVHWFDEKPLKEML